MGSVLNPREWPESTLAQAFADAMYDRLQHLVNVSHGCVRAGNTKELIRIARDIQDEFATRITHRESWVEHENPDTADDSANKSTDLEAYLGTQYLIDLKKPRTEGELKTLINQRSPEQSLQRIDSSTEGTETKELH